MFEMGESEQIIIRQCLRFGDPIPEKIKNAPELQKGLEIYLQAFFDLDSERSGGMGLTRIPWSSIRDYGLFYEFDSDQIEDLFYHVRKMDDANLKRLSKKNPK